VNEDRQSAEGEWSYIVASWAGFIPVLHSGNPDLIWRALNKPSIFYEGKPPTETFFARFIGWPEGRVYCSSGHYWEKSGCAMVLRHLPQLEQALRLLRPLESEAK